jgi:Tfp pilus assembly protein FimT
MLSFQEQQYQATLEGFTGVPAMPKGLAEARLVSLQEELAALDPQAEGYAVAQQTLTREIQETQTALDSGTLTEDPAEIQAFYDYNKGLHNFIIGQQPQ